MAQTFNEALMSARRQAAMSGQRLSSSEVRDIAAGVASTSADTAYKLKTAETAEEELALEEAKLEETKLQNKRSNQAAATTAGATLGAELGAAGSIGGPWGAVIGAAAGYVIGGSFFCDEVHKQVTLDHDTLVNLIKLRKYIKTHHGPWMDFYNQYGPTAVDNLKRELGLRFIDECHRLKVVIVEDVVGFMVSGAPERAYERYKDLVLPLILIYAPGAKDEPIVAQEVG